MLEKTLIVTALCLAANLAQAEPRAPRILLIDACGQMRDNAFKIWSDEKLVSIRENRDANVVYCFVANGDRTVKSTFAVAPGPEKALGETGREALRAACEQMQKNSEVFGGRRVYFAEDPDIKVVYCLVRKPDSADLPMLEVTDPRFVYTVEMLFMSYYGEPLDRPAQGRGQAI